MDAIQQFIAFIESRCAADACVLTRAGYVPLTQLLKEWEASRDKQG